MRFFIKVITRASKDEIIERTDTFIKVKLTVAPIRGAANKQLIKLLAKEFNIRKIDVIIVKGEYSSDKIVDIKI